MEAQLLVFVSSVINELIKERGIIEETVRSIGLTAPWVFEYTPAAAEQVQQHYLRKVRECDIFILLVADYVSAPVKEEYAIAVVHNKPILAFVKRTSTRSIDTTEFIGQLKGKFATFDAADFAGLIKISLIEELIVGYKLGRLKPLGSDAATVGRVRHDLTAHRILARWADARFTALDRSEPRSPIELIKERLVSDNVLALMAQVPKAGSFEDQIALVTREHYASAYLGSLAEEEAQLVGRYLVDRLIGHSKGIQISCLYDAGCASCGQFHTLTTIPNQPAQPFRYVGQDFNPDWEPRVRAVNGQFVLQVLPIVASGDSFQCVSCIHTLHYLERNPLAVYTCFFSFNAILIQGGHCYIAVPEKEAQPGMLDLLERSASDAQFEILASGRCRLMHALSDDAANNVTTFLYLILRKQGEIDPGSRNELLGASLYRGRHPRAADFGVQREGDIPEDLQLLEGELQEMLQERNPYLRTFGYALRVLGANGQTVEAPASKEVCVDLIRNAIEKVHHNLTGGTKAVAALSRACADYFRAMLSWYLANSRGLDLRATIIRTYPIVERMLKGDTDVRVHLDDLTPEQVARLFRHLAEICQHEGIDLRRAFDESLVLKTSKLPSITPGR